MSRQLVFAVSLVTGAAIFGILIPYVMKWWVLLYLLSFGAAPSPRLGFLVILILLGILGWLFLSNRESQVTRGLFFGSVAGLAIFVAVLPVLVRREKVARMERERIIFSTSSALESLQVLDSGGQPIWRVEAVGEPEHVEKIRYGVVPPRYKQEVPLVGTPRPFHVGELLTVEASTVASTETRNGRASGPDGIQTSESRNRSRLGDARGTKSP